MTTDFAYDNSIVLPDTKNDGSHLTAEEWNQLCDAATSLRAAVQGGLYHGLQNTFSNPPALSPVGESIATSMSGQRVVSENAGPYIWIRNVEYINMGDQRFGLVGDGTTDDTTAVQAAINATVSSSNSAKKRVLYVPGNVQIRLRAPVTVSAALGFTMVGEGKWTSQFIVDPLVPSDNGLVINSSQHVTLEGFSLFGKSSNPAGKMLFFSYDPIVYASYATDIKDLWIGSNDSREAYDYGIYWSDAYGNNSEVNYWACFIERFKEAGVILPGSQQKAHSFFGCHINGAWDGVAANANGGKYGVRQGGGVVTPGSGGSFQYFGGGIGYCRQSGFALEYSNDPITMVGVQSEGCYRFIDMGEVALGNSTPVSVRTCRLDTAGNVFDTNGYIKFAGQGPFIVESCTLKATGQGGAIPRIRISATGDLTALRLTQNNFLTADSVSTAPIIQGGSGFAPVEEYGNFFRDSGGAIALRDEALNINPSDSLAGGPGNISQFRFERAMYYVPYTAFTANAGDESVIALTIPKGTKVCDAYAHLATAYAHPTASSISIKLGKTSGGDEYLLDFDGTVDNALYGNTKAQCGTSLDGSLNQNGDVPSYSATTNLYVTVTLGSGTLGNGSTTSLTAGDLRLILRLEVLPRTPTSG